MMPTPNTSLPPPSNKKPVIITIVVLLSIAVLIGVGVLLFHALDGGEPDSPEDAVEQYMEAFSSEDTDTLTDLSCEKDLDELGTTGPLASSDKDTTVDVTYSVGEARKTSFAGHEEAYLVDIELNGKMTVGSRTLRYDGPEPPMPVVKEDGNWRVCQTLK